MSFFHKLSVATCLATAAISGIANAAVGGSSVNSTILVLAPEGDSSYSATSGFDAYGIPYQLLTVPQGGASLPPLNSTAKAGNYGGILILSDVSYDYDGDYHSALTDAQYTTLYSYQVAFGVRMVRLDTYPDEKTGTTVVTASDGSSGCCADNVEQLISFTNTTGFATANLKSGATISTKNLYHYPAKITDSKTTWKIAQFATSGNFKSSSVAAVINNFSGREQMAFFLGFATEWSATSNYLQHSYIHWITRGLFVGARKVYLGTQIDDMHLVTDLYYPSGKQYRVVPADVSAHISWMQSVNSRLASGSNYFVEIGHNGNGDIINATNIGYNLDNDPCIPVDAVYYDSPIESPDLEYQKPIGSGIDMWPPSFTNYSWSLPCCKLDKLATWFMTAANRDAFAHVSHTFTHLNLNNATYHDASREIFFNQAWMKQVSIDAGKFSSHGLIPPAITGMHNGDVIKAWLDNGITNVVGDNSRPVLMNPNNVHHLLVSTVAANGYAGLNIMPRWPTAIYFDCDTQACTTQEWTDTSAGTGKFADLLAFERDTTTRYLFGLRHDPYMFHQANMRATGVSAYKVGSQSVRSLLQIWVETVIQEMIRLTNWPIITLKHDDIAKAFLDREARDACSPSLTYTYAADGKTITGATVYAANGNTCSVPVPVTFPGTASVSSGGSASSDSVGAEPLIMWANLKGQPVTFSLGTAVSVL
ncbi:hypothetical protein Q7P37_011014 [Cladosporium fusiforme]